MGTRAQQHLGATLATQDMVVFRECGEGEEDEEIQLITKQVSRREQPSGLFRGGGSVIVE